MCAIAGILFKNGKRNRLKMTTGKALTEMLDATLHRGPDSAGWALYREPLTDELRLRFFVAPAEKGESEIRFIHSKLEAEGAHVVRGWREGCTCGMRIRYGGDLLSLTRTVERVCKPVSMGRSLDIIKDVGQPRELADRYGIVDFDGSHGIAHIRLATESGVHPDTSHPFWASGFADVATVHNGQITNYWIMRRRLERQGMTFQTENDTELVAVYLAYQMSQGDSLEAALATSVDDLDGTFSYLVSTHDAIGYAKDPLAAKPLVVYENDELIAVSSEDVGINRLFPGQSLETSEPPPGTFGLWKRNDCTLKGV
jgi:methylamine---glutamate N-methyltransferase subunit A